MLPLLTIPGLLAAQEVVPGDTLQIRLLDRLGSGRRAPSVVHGLVIAPLMRGSRAVVPPGSVVSGRVTGAGKENLGGKRHWIALQLDSLAIPFDDVEGDTLRTDLSARFVAVDDAREATDSAGRLIGPPKGSIIRSKRDWALLALGVFHPVGAAMLAAAVEGEIAELHRGVALEVGTELTAVITRGDTLARWSSWQPPPAIVDVAKSSSIAAQVPMRAQWRAGKAPGDVIAIALVGSAAQVESAFAAAGWTPAVRTSVKSDVVAFVKAAKGQGDHSQPMSKLELNGRIPDREYEKVADSYMRRHHLRMWRWPSDSANGDSTLWLVAATHDVGLMFIAKRHSFTHRIDPCIDLERDKIVSDLVAANAVAAMSYVRRTAPAQTVLVNDGRAPVTTDWRMAVIALKSP